ncbi:MmcQ/YjbR family DNA-binding protein [Jatrophihabitans telluris]|uniref:MmcQ/YjbR family DNA-binding protein n=1 Tax=Jatrophihabitans telluris TaxID=2038343 RepID=A0ABY4QT59_9ACTN|nr:MmcQ/YjbR family DNA-binding protein [Jatrophihabitans telluris]UQX86678.1 MmcQ/YjbR family DNA-binding protein [Jatrophihabitans telluris]
MATWDDVRERALALPETSESTVGAEAYRGFSVRDKAFAWERPLRTRDLAELGDRAPRGVVLAVRVADEGAKHALIADDPAVYFTTSHFDGYPAVLIRLEELDPAELDEILVEAWISRAPKRVVKEFLGD